MRKIIHVCLGLNPNLTEMNKKNFLVISLKMYFFSGSLLPEIKQIHLEQKLLIILEEQQFALVNLHINTDLILT